MEVHNYIKLLALGTVGVLVGCSKSTKSPDVLDAGIEKNLDAALITSRLPKEVNFSVRDGVVTLAGKVNSKAQRARAETVASPILNVKQVVNELEIKNSKATSSN
jgi:osmotically-inducible protein OsmY